MLGTVCAASVSSFFITKLNPKAVFFIGVSGGYSSDVKFGDV